MEDYTDDSNIYYEDQTWHFRYKEVDFIHYAINYKKKGGFKSQAEACKAYNQEKEKYESDIKKIKRMTDIKYTFLEYLDYWYQSIYSPYVGESRRCVYAWALYKIIYPSVIQDVLLNKITANYINQLLDRCKDYCLSAAPVSKGLIRIALHDAEIDSYITYNPMREVKSYT